MNNILCRQPATQGKRKGDGSAAQTFTTEGRGDLGRHARSAQGPSSAHRAFAPPDPKDTLRSNVTPHPVRGSADHHRSCVRPEAAVPTGQLVALKEKMAPR